MNEKSGGPDFNRTAVIFDTFGKYRNVDPTMEFYALCKPMTVESKS